MKRTGGLASLLGLLTGSPGATDYSKIAPRFNMSAIRAHDRAALSSPRSAMAERSAGPVLPT